MEAIDPGALRERMTPEAANDVPDGAGGVVRSWQAQAPVWAAVRPLSATAGERAGRSLDRARYEVTVRGNRGLKAGMRLLWRGRILDILATRPLDAGGRYLLLLCEEQR
ncbi:MAG: phage head closure protein [Rhodothalassiaceae bacterium]